MIQRKSHWTEIPLGKILRYCDERIVLDDEAEYLTITVRRRHGGLEIREKLLGHQIATKKQFRLIPGAFIISRVQCWHQAYAFVGNPPQNAIASSNYDQFEISEDVDSRFFWWLSHSPEFTKTVRSSAVGVVVEKMVFNRDEWLSRTVQIPPLAEQLRIVSHIDALAAKITRARLLRDEVSAGSDALCRALIFGPAARHQKVPMGDFMTRRAHDITVRPDKSYQFAGVYCFGRGLFQGQRRLGTEFAYKQLTTIYSGDFVYPKLMAWEGALAIVPPECDGMVVSPEFPVFRLNTQRILPEVVDVYFRTPSVWPELAGTSTGTNVRRRRLNPADFLRYKMPVPPMPVQQQLRQIRAKTEALKKIQVATAAELDALLPSILDKAFKGEL